ncbi:EFR1 family ferrodoxin [Sphaerochaeta sp.]|jgi:ferredoxin|uniref:EFR1 family ferrodoxin n=1 Tax=Sphaerochaeta sp. TaxID=1972642 RepID=UPI002A365D81|nr:EFR1 family ferrodoxin [Sphaerochaeta sp.]MDX9984558.1 EFR1 family ferrodoxin [Sphaerochaeta sp.]
MKTTLICFSGTGNSYYIAKRLASELGDNQILMIPHLMQNQEFELTEQVGFVFPVYKGFPPNLVTHFIQEVFAKQDLSPIKYLFQVATRYMFQAYTFQAMDVVLKEAGALTSYVNHVVMPDGYVPLLSAPTEAKIDELYTKADRKIAQIAEDVKQEQIKLPFRPPFSRLAINHFMVPIHRSFMDTALDFSVTDACISCGLCYRMCPSFNIEMVDGKPEFDRACTGCLGCYHRCPAQAIVFKQKVKSGRYPNPRSTYTVEYRT